MNPVTHLLISWVVAYAGELNTPDRAIVTVGGDRDSIRLHRRGPLHNFLHPGL
jgi:hypothetical protein